MITAILKLKTTMPALAAECLELFSEGARPDSNDPYYFFSLCNTEPINGYFRVIVADHIAVELQWMMDNGKTSENAELIKVEWDGQDADGPFQVGTDVDGNPQYLTRFTS